MGGATKESTLIFEVKCMVTAGEIFSGIYKGYVNRLTPYINAYCGSIDENGNPADSQFICELSHGRYNETPVYGVTVIEFNHSKRTWEKNIELSKSTLKKEKAQQYANDILRCGYSRVMM